MMYKNAIFFDWPRFSISYYTAFIGARPAVGHPQFLRIISKLPIFRYEYELKHIRSFLVDIIIDNMFCICKV